MFTSRGQVTKVDSGKQKTRSNLKHNTVLKDSVAAGATEGVTPAELAPDEVGQ